MFQSVRQKKRSQEKAEIKIAPLIDMVFILLIFFIVTTSFVSETGISVERPSARSGSKLSDKSLRLGIGSSGEIFLSGRRIGIFALKPILQSKVRNQPDISVILVADKAVSAEQIVSVMDQVRLSGIQRIALATEKKTAQ